jgi:hypothetical protein
MPPAEVNTQPQSVLKMEQALKPATSGVWKDDGPALDSDRLVTPKRI